MVRQVLVRKRHFTAALGVATSLGCSAAPAPSAKSQASSSGACTLAGPGPLTPLSRTSSSVALATSGGRTLAFVADEDTNRVLVVDLQTRQQLSAFDVGSPPSALVVTESGNVAVTLPRRAELRVLSFDGKALASRCSVETPAEPVALALTPDGSSLLAVSAWGHTLSSYATANLKPQQQVELAREPRGVLVEPGGKRAFVSHAVGGVLSVVDLGSRQVQQVSLNTPPPPGLEQRQQALRESFAAALASMPPAQRPLVERALTQQLAAMSGPQRVGNQGFALAFSVEPRGRLFVPQVEVDPGPAGQRTGGYGSGGQAAATPAVAVVDLGTLKPEQDTTQPAFAWVEAQLVAGREACRLPRAAAMDDASGRLFVSCVGSDTLIGYDAASPNPIDAEVARVSVPGGPTGLAVDGKNRRVVVWSQFERALSLVPIAPSGGALASEDVKPLRIDLPRVAGAGLSEQLALGRRLFHAVDDGRIAADGRACASCHINGRDDGLVWSTPGGPRRTKTLAGMLHQSAPYSWDGSAASVHDQLHGTFERLSGAGGLRGVELDALAAYVSSLPPPPRAERPDAALLARGATLFASDETGCATCHNGTQKTDNGRHPVQSETLADVTPRFDTPGLSFLEGRAPYFHDGRYATLRELLVGNNDKMGHTAQLSPRDLDALEAYLRTL